MHVITVDCKRIASVAVFSPRAAARACVVGTRQNATVRVVEWTRMRGEARATQSHLGVGENKGRCLRIAHVFQGERLRGRDGTPR